MRRLVALTVAMIVAGCGGESSGPDTAADVIDRELFIQTMVDLRMDALDNTPMVIAEQEKEAILRERGVTEQDLRDFVEAHGRELVYMRDLWAEVEARILVEIDPEAANDTLEGNE